MRAAPRVPCAQSNTTTPGFTLGFGGEYQPSSLQLAGHPVSVFAQYQHTWWSNANFKMPPSSPVPINYAFRREDGTIKLGVGAAPAPATPAYPVKALLPEIDRASLTVMADFGHGGPT